ncbi:hypothetical protein M413DRAFT_440260 [Hebeloma cylindrosporum]|uniref:Enoyl reductase (ER) domain-containing protein n=1 Tax=Hebeloma cylindrosporum TaxID=76867 RepID=A0A0C2YA21_HEBCY|nr:hypothetical protein M413DRAFT_440260 [Hebeloma cylindrosporum h7]
MSLPSNIAAILFGPRDVRTEERPIWRPTPGEAQVKVVATGLCGSDLHYYSDARNGDFVVRAPLVLGHEASGIVTAISPGVTNLKVGQRVAIEAGINCRSCPLCQKGRYNLCKEMRFCSSASRYPHVDGTLQARFNHPAYVLHPLPDNVSFELAALAEPLSVLIHASRRIGLLPPRLTSYLPSSSASNQSILVFGVGTIGLLACALAKHQGAKRVVAIDIKPARLEFAKQNGFADDVFCVPAPDDVVSAYQPDACCSIPTKTPGQSVPLSKSHSHSHPPPAQAAEDILRKAQIGAMEILSAFGAPEGFDIVFECTGSESAIQMSVFAATAGGRVMLIGMGTKNAYLPLSTAALREVDIFGSFRYANTYPEAIALLSAKSPLPKMVAKLVTHRFKLGSTQKAFEMLERGFDDNGGLVLKVMVGSGIPC